MTVAVKIRSKDTDVFAPFNAEALAAFINRTGSDILTLGAEGVLPGH